MNVLDIALLCLVVAFLIRGFFRGLVQEVLSLLAILLGAYLAANYQYVLVPHLELYIKSEITVNTLAYVLIFIGTIIAFWLLARLIKTVLDISLLGWVDRTAGGVLGLFEGALIGLIVLMFLQSFAPESEWVTESYIAPRTQHLMQTVEDLTPDFIKNIFKSGTLDISPQEVLDSAKEATGMDDKSE